MLLAALLRAAAARADGDPASDMLLGENVFYPYSPPVAALGAARRSTRRRPRPSAGFPIKVALIAAPIDLGVIPDLFGKPQPYAHFLDQEISFQGQQRLLVVMAAGYGLEGFAARRRSRRRGLPSHPAGKTSTDLARAA